MDNTKEIIAKAMEPYFNRIFVGGAERPREEAVEAILNTLSEANLMVVSKDVVEALTAHEEHMQRGIDLIGKYLPPDSKISKDELISRLIYHFDGPEQRALSSIKGQSNG